MVFWGHQTITIAYREFITVIEQRWVCGPVAAAVEYTDYISAAG